MQRTAFIFLGGRHPSSPGPGASKEPCRSHGNGGRRLSLEPDLRPPFLRRQSLGKGSANKGLEKDGVPYTYRLAPVQFPGRPVPGTKRTAWHFFGSGRRSAVYLKDQRPVYRDLPETEEPQVIYADGCAEAYRDIYGSDRQPLPPAT